MEDLLEPFVEPNLTTEADRATEARYWAHLRAIEAAAEAQVAEITAKHPEDCPECGLRMEWSAGEPEYWSCPDCGHWEK